MNLKMSRVQILRFIINCSFFYDMHHINEDKRVTIDLLAILQKSLDRAIFLYTFILEARLSGVKAFISIAHIRKFYKI